MEESQIPEKYRYIPVRRKIYEIGLQSLLKCLKGDIHDPNLPNDVQIIAGYFSPRDQAFLLILESKEYPQVMPPMLLDTEYFGSEVIIF